MEPYEQQDQNDSAQNSNSDQPSASGGLSSFWGFGSSLVDSVAKNATNLVHTIVDTDWQKELQDIQQGLRDDTRQVEEEIERKLGWERSAAVSPAGDATVSSPAAGDEASPAPLGGLGLSSLAAFGHSLVTGTTELFEQVRAKVDAEIQAASREANRKARSARSKGRESRTRFSRLVMQISAMQRSSATYCDEPEDAQAYAAFCEAYDAAARQGEIDTLLSGNAFMAELHSRLVPLVVSEGDFWRRYFSRLDALKAVDEQRQQMLQRAHQQAASDSWGDDFEALTSPQGAAPVAPGAPASGATSAKPASLDLPVAGAAVPEEALHNSLFQAASSAPATDSGAKGPSHGPVAVASASEGGAGGSEGAEGGMGGLSAQEAHGHASELSPTAGAVGCGGGCGHEGDAVHSSRGNEAERVSVAGSAANGESGGASVAGSMSQEEAAEAHRLGHSAAKAGGASDERERDGARDDGSGGAAASSKRLSTEGIGNGGSATGTNDRAVSDWSFVSEPGSARKTTTRDEGSLAVIAHSGVGADNSAADLPSYSPDGTVDVIDEALEPDEGIMEGESNASVQEFETTDNVIKEEEEEEEDWGDWD